MSELFLRSQEENVIAAFNRRQVLKSKSKPM